MLRDPPLNCDNEYPVIAEAIDSILVVHSEGKVKALMVSGRQVRVRAGRRKVKAMRKVRENEMRIA